MEIIGVIVAGIIIGLLGKFVAPSNRDNIPLWLTILCGIGGVIIGWYVYVLFGGNGSPGIDWVRWLIAIVVAAVLVMIASMATARMGARRTQVEALPPIPVDAPLHSPAPHLLLGRQGGSGASCP